MKRRAFTLVELLGVIGIISVLIAILLPVLAGAREQASRVKCLSNLRQLGTAMVAYTQDNNGYYPFAGDVGAAAYEEDWLHWKIPWTGSSTPAGRDISNSALAKHLGGQPRPEIFRCPSDDISFRARIDRRGPYYYSYGMNMRFSSYRYRLSGDQVEFVVRNLRLLPVDVRGGSAPTRLDSVIRSSCRSSRLRFSSPTFTRRSVRRTFR